MTNFQRLEVRTARGSNHWNRRGDRLPRVVMAFILCAVALVAIPANAATKGPSVGLEGHAFFDLPRADYQVKPVDDRAELILRIESVTPVGTNGHRYAFHYIGFEPQEFDAATYLLRPDGEPAEELSNLIVRVGSVLPPNHDGRLADTVRSPFPWSGGYRAVLWALGACWIAGLAWFAWNARRRKVIPPPPPVPPPTLAELMRPLVEAASRGTLSAEGQAQLERMLMNFWRERLSLDATLPMRQALARLKEHPEAGPLIRSLERWLHSPRGAASDEVVQLLAPYATARVVLPTEDEVRRVERP